MPDVVRYSSHGLNKEQINDQTTFDHLNTELVRYSDPHCNGETGATYFILHGDSFAHFFTL